MRQRKSENRAKLLISCPDRPGIVSTISTFLHEEGANIVQSDQYTTDPESGMFYMRVEFDLEDFDQSFENIQKGIAPIADRLTMEWRLESEKRMKRMAIFVSKQDHCLLELLWKWRSGELLVDIPLVISNHQDLRETVEAYGISFYHIPVTKDTKAETEQRQIQLLKQYDIDFIALARYMQILSSTFVAAFPKQIINIHHSFLPAFVGANPYDRAFDRGVKLIGATAHYVTDDLDEGPIIEQDVLRVNHKFTAEQLKIAGRDVERITFARAVAWHNEDRIITYGNKTIVFS
ncbi:formyltetrahydrofolate deformylase [Alkalihalobacterium sp. APHAB7]|uniref:formyltetrahydrofolate deformylase n=1 Tax=Alkalihalobacterium sp. APHAB7 TaxID=3402081 RepID=UPI003AAB6C38